MEVNINKTKIIHFRKKCCERNHVDFYLSGLNIEICENYKYLGIILNEFLDFTETANVLSVAAGRAFSSLVTNLYNKTDLMYSSYTKIYDSKLVPIMDYCSSVWGDKCYSKPDTLHDRIIRYFLDVHKCTSNAVIQGDMEWIPPHIRRQLNCLRLWNRLLDLDANRITKRIFVWDYTRNKLNWCRDVNNILKGIDLRHKFEIALTDSHAAKTIVNGKI